MFKIRNILALLCSFLLIGQQVMAQDSFGTKDATPKHYPNPYEPPDPNRPVAEDPFTWKDFPAGIEYSSDQMQEAYKQASQKFDGYKILQLAKIEYDEGFTYGTLNPNKMIDEAFGIAVINKDPFLAFYLTQFNTNETFSASIAEVREMAKITYQLALEKKEPKVLHNLANLEDARNLIIVENISTKDLRKQALFIHNTNYAPYPNPYDNPDPDKPLNVSPFVWKNFPADIDTGNEMNMAYKKAVKDNDGYTLLQLSKIELDNNYSKEVTPENLIQQAYNIANYNKDPYLLIHITLFEKEANVLKNIEPTDIFKNAYNAGVERKDVSSLSFIYDYEKKNDFLPELTPNKILMKIKELKNEKPLI